MNEANEPAVDEAQLRAALPEEIEARVRSARMVAGRAVIVAETGETSAKGRERIEAAITDALGKLDGVDEVRVALMAERVKRRMIAIGSGKGGVGKSTLTTNLAIAMSQLGHKVGVIDADIYGPSQPRLLGNEADRPVAEDEQLIPIDTPHGIKLLSMGSLVNPGKALAWRGPMAGSALGQLVEARWGDTDLLLIDLPPGTGDVQLSMMQKHKPDGAVLVSTPQDIALLDAARAGQLFEQGDIPIIGLVENMAGYACPHCGEVSDPFGQGGVEKFATTLEIPFMGRIPLSLDIRVKSDAGTPPTLSDDDDAAAFKAIAAQLATWLEQKAA
ncbi:MAG: Mrp/NBP35 family ATP-binding protein [Pseudomonadota bacterium]